MKFSSFLWFIIFQSAMTGILKSWYSVMTGIKIKNRGLRLLKYCKHVQGVLNDFGHQNDFRTNNFVDVNLLRSVGFLIFRELGSAPLSS